MKYLSSSGENLFQKIKKIVSEYEEKNGKGSSVNIAIGAPDLNPPELLRKITAEYVLKNENWIHTYWDNCAPEGFIEGMLRYHTGLELNNLPHLRGLALPGEKTIIGLLPISCGSNMNNNPNNVGFLITL